MIAAHALNFNNLVMIKEYLSMCKDQLVPGVNLIDNSNTICTLFLK